MMYWLQIWMKPRIQMTALDEGAIALEFFIALGLVLLVIFLLDRLGNWRHRRAWRRKREQTRDLENK